MANVSKHKVFRTELMLGYMLTNIKEQSVPSLPYKGVCTPVNAYIRKPLEGRNVGGDLV